MMKIFSTLFLLFITTIGSLISGVPVISEDAKKIITTVASEGLKYTTKVKGPAGDKINELLQGKRVLGQPHPVFKQCIKNQPEAAPSCAELTADEMSLIKSRISELKLLTPDSDYSSCLLQQDAKAKGEIQRLIADNNTKLFGILATIEKNFETLDKQYLEVEHQYDFLYKKFDPLASNVSSLSGQGEACALSTDNSTFTDLAGKGGLTNIIKSLSTNKDKFKDTPKDLSDLRNTLEELSVAMRANDTQSLTSKMPALKNSFAQNPSVSNAYSKAIDLYASPGQFKTTLQNFGYRDDQIKAIISDTNPLASFNNLHSKTINDCLGDFLSFSSGKNMFRCKGNTGCENSLNSVKEILNAQNGLTWDEKFSQAKNKLRLIAAKFFKNQSLEEFIKAQKKRCDNNKMQENNKAMTVSSAYLQAQSVVKDYTANIEPKTLIKNVMTSMQDSLVQCPGETTSFKKCSDPDMGSYSGKSNYCYRTKNECAQNADNCYSYWSQQKVQALAIMNTRIKFYNTSLDAMKTYVQKAQTMIQDSQTAMHQLMNIQYGGYFSTTKLMNYTPFTITFEENKELSMLRDEQGALSAIKKPPTLDEVKKNITNAVKEIADYNASIAANMSSAITAEANAASKEEEAFSNSVSKNLSECSAMIKDNAKEAKDRMASQKDACDEYFKDPSLICANADKLAAGRLLDQLMEIINSEIEIDENIFSRKIQGKEHFIILKAYCTEFSNELNNTTWSSKNISEQEAILNKIKSLKPSCGLINKELRKLSTEKDIVKNEEKK
jgi:hypothetical protein